VPRFQVLTEGRAFEGTVVVLSSLFAAAAYFDAWTYVNTTSGRSLAEPWQDAALHLSWFLLAAYLVAVMTLNIRRGSPVTRSLPAGYGWTFIGCVGFSAMVLLDRWAQLGLGPALGLSALLSPPRVGEIIAGGLMVSGPLRAAWRRKDDEAGLPAIIAAALVLSVITFVTQFAHPFRDPWAAGAVQPREPIYWVAEDLGVASLFLQGTAYVATFLLLLRRFQIRLGSFTLICLINGALVASLKGHWEMLVVAGVTGIVADAAYRWLRPGAARPGRLRAFAFLVPASFAASFFVVVAFTQGVWWPSHIWSGAILVTGLGGLLISYLAYTPGGRQSGAEPDERPRPAHWPEITPSAIKKALEDLSDRRALAANPLTRLPYLGRAGGDAATELDELLRDAARELSTSTVLPQAQAGHLLVDYYVKRNGTHDQIAERLHLSKAVYFRRLQDGCELLADRLEKLSAFTETI
jgi:hypothetical protein